MNAQDLRPVPALLVLEDGRAFRGRSFGAAGETFGEAVFATGMSGYQETLTDPSYHRQVVVATAPHIGNTGWNDEDDESGRIWVAGYVVRDPSRIPSNWRSVRSLDDELRAQSVVGISDIDTRALTRHLRERGAMRVGISTETLDADALLAKVLQSPQMEGANLVGDVTVAEPYTLKYGHRGINQPVQDRTTGKVEITAHNHGFAVDAPADRPTTTPYGIATVSHICLNDSVVEGLELTGEDGVVRGFSVQYHPEAAAGPHDAAYLFQRFADVMSGVRSGGAS